MANAVFSEETIHMMASGLLVLMGVAYIMQYRLGCGGHRHSHHSHDHSVERMAIIGLILVPTLSPCATTLPVFLTAASSNDRMEFVVLAVLLLCSTLTVMLTLVTLSYLGVARLKGAAIEGISRYDKLAVGSCLCLVGVLTQLTHHHDHDHGGPDDHDDHDGHDVALSHRLLRRLLNA
eukprot:CAMPEP_0118937564 /NCGR_PEP_ID=MMETSP1169-20130426/23157_1 /TAXON_ID=36882 /ORGANISM="Pyramimonas obovata, Strain CCMP722" /LENGTH=177 /DNA_ID=CAMNT_0006881237 /DNA_START=520 /DNA_END=1053 /DNA_ORIENTATION=+